MRIINFNSNYTSTKPLFNKFRILSFDETVNLQNCLLVLNVGNNKVPKTLQEFFSITNQHLYNTRAAYHKKLNLPQVTATHYRVQSIKYKSAKVWNEIQTKISDKRNVAYWSKNRLLKFFKKYYFNNAS